MAKKLFLIFALFLVSICLYNPQIIKASNFDNAYVRLDTLKSNSALSGTVCAQPSSAGAGTESKVIIAFPSDFTISSTASNWTTSASNLPAGSTAWPSIGSTATSVSGQSVIFSSSDLSLDVLYCFNFNAASSTTGSAGSGKVGTIVTQNSSNSPIDYLTYALSVVSSNDISITASVDPQVSDLPIAIDSDNAGVDMPQNTTITYTITYGLSTLVAFPLTITCSWSQGTIQGNPSPSVDIVDYAIGSGSNGYNSTAPVVDSINNKITWTYSSFPAATTNQTVTFKLKTNSAYTGSLPVSFDISAKSTSNSTTTPDQTLTQTYKYVPASTPTPTPTEAPAPTSAPSTATATPTPTPSPIPLPTFTSLEVRTISQDNANIFVATNVKTKTTVIYGTSSTLNKSISFSDYSLSRLINLKDLLPNTQYYFKIIAKDSLNQSVSSDIFTFTTAKISTPTIVDENSIIIVSANNVVFDTSSKTATSAARNSAIIPQNTSFQFKFSLKNNKSAKKVRLLLRRITGKNVLGENTLIPIASANAASVTVLELTPGVYSAVVDTNQEYGTYQVIASFIDESGNLVEQPLMTLKISNPFTVLDINSNPIEGVRIFLYVYNENEKIFIPLSPTFIHINNPSFSNNKGVVDFVLPKGRYKAQLINLGFREKTVIFTVGDDQSTGYPIVYMEKTALNIIEFINFYWHTFNEVFLFNTYSYVTTLQNSIRFFDLIAAITLFLLVILTFYAFLRKNNIEHLPSYFIYLFHHLTNSPNKDKYIKGLIREKDGAPIYGVHIYLIDDESQEVIANTNTNKNGEFFFKKGNSTYYLIAMKKGYFSTSQIEARKNGFIEYNMEKKTYKEIVIIKYWRKILNGIFSISFEMLLFSSLFFQLIFINYFGVTKTTPFLIISFFNIVVWVMHLRHARHHPTRIR